MTIRVGPRSVSSTREVIIEVAHAMRKESHAADHGQPKWNGTKSKRHFSQWRTNVRIISVAPSSKNGDWLTDLSSRILKRSLSWLA
jgi:hypothetical protein